VGLPVRRVGGPDRCTLTRWNEGEIAEMYAITDSFGVPLRFDLQVTPRDAVIAWIFSFRRKGDKKPILSVCHCVAGGLQTATVAFLQDWNNQLNGSGVHYNVTVSSTPPNPGTANTIIVAYDDNFSNSEVASLTMHSSSGPSGGSVYGEMVFHKNIRVGTPSFLPAFVRETSRHEGGHGIGLDNASNCPPGSTIMNPAGDGETFITQCDNNAVSSDPAYATLADGGNSSCTPSPDYLFWCSQEHFAMNWDECWCGPTPIAVDTVGDGFQLSASANGVTFDINGNGTPDHISWTVPASDDAWLALDRNGNGNIDNGQELFGDFTAQPSSTNANRKESTAAPALRADMKNASISASGVPSGTPGFEPVM